MLLFSIHSVAFFYTIFLSVLATKLLLIKMIQLDYEFSWKILFIEAMRSKVKTQRSKVSDFKLLKSFLNQFVSNTIF